MQEPRKRIELWTLVFVKQWTILCQLMSHMLGHFDPIMITCFPCNFNSACDKNCLHYIAVVWLINSFKKSESSVLKTKLVSKCKALTRMPSRKKNTMLATYLIFVNYLLRTRATVENIADTKDEITMFPPLPNRTLAQYAENIIAKVL